jgi:hypothetical protein
MFGAGKWGAVRHARSISVAAAEGNGEGRSVGVAISPFGNGGVK